jgi:hypothetical protein
VLPSGKNLLALFERPEHPPELHASQKGLAKAEGLRDRLVEAASECVELACRSAEIRVSLLKRGRI